MIHMQKYEYKVITSWGEGPDDVMLVVTFPDGRKEWIDISAEDAFILADDLVKAAKYAKELETGYFDAELGSWLLEQLFKDNPPQTIELR